MVLFKNVFLNEGNINNYTFYNFSSSVTEGPALGLKDIMQRCTSPKSSFKSLYETSTAAQMLQYFLWPHRPKWGAYRFWPFKVYTATIDSLYISHQQDQDNQCVGGMAVGLEVVYVFDLTVSLFCLDV